MERVNITDVVAFHSDSSVSNSFLLVRIKHFLLILWCTGSRSGLHVFRRITFFSQNKKTLIRPNKYNLVNDFF